MTEAEPAVTIEGFTPSPVTLLRVYRDELIETIDACAAWKAAAIEERAAAMAKAKPGRKPKSGGDHA